MDTSLFLLPSVLCLLAATSGLHGTVVESKADPAHSDLYQQLLSRVENLELRDQDQQKEIDTLKLELHAEKQRTSALEGIMSALIGSGEEGNTGARQTSDNADQADPPPAAKKFDVKSIHESIHSERKMANHVPRVRRHGDTPVVAFYATLKKDIEHAGQNQVIVFEHDVTNIGGAYNPHVGSFVAPVSGVYVFSVTIMGSNHTENFACYLMINGQIEGKMWVRSSEAPDQADSITVIFHLNKGDDVAVQHRNSDKFIEGGEYSMFTGFLLHSDEPGLAIVTGK